MHRSAIFSTCRRYRYLLSRHWDEHLPTLLIIGLNPSTAGATHDDPTIKRCIGFAQSWGYGSLHVANLFALMATQPKDLLADKAPVGQLNDRYLRQLIKACDRTVVAWGNYGTHLERNLQVLAFIKKPYCLKINKNGQPAHPLYQKADTRLRAYTWPTKI
ncbi:MAG: DUF1643 domain-containing protein [Bacteroidota bacterium]